MGNSPYGVWIAAPNNLVGTDGDGTSDVFERNVISGNDVGIYNAANNTTIAGNFIGTNQSGTAEIGNLLDGIDSIGIGTTIGTDADGSLGDSLEGNLISGNERWGIYLHGGGSQVVAGNLIGLDVFGENPIANADAGIYITSDDNRIGTLTHSIERNVISGNDGPGITISDADDNQITGNFVGTDRLGTTAIGNATRGINIINAIGTQIGGPNNLDRNIISGNEGQGIRIRGAEGDSIGNTIENNHIGTDISGLIGIPNQNKGILLGFESSQTEIVDNLVASNLGGEILIDSSSTNTLSGNLIGVNKTGAASLAGDSVAVTVFNSPQNELQNNVIVANSFDELAYALVIDSADDTLVTGNKIQTNASGTAALGYASGIVVSGGSSGTFIGINDEPGSEPVAADGNLIATTFGSGVFLGSANSTVIAGNLIGINASQTGSIAGLSGAGIQVSGNAGNTRIGTDVDESSDELEPNVIGGYRHGIRIDEPVAPSGGTEIAGNFVGVGSNGIQSLGNQQYGILVFGDPQLTIGPANTIAFNGFFGIGIDDANADSLTYSENQVFGNGLGGIDLKNDQIATPNDTGDVDGYLNFPIITSAEINNGILTVEGFVGAGLQIEFYLTSPTTSGFGQGKDLLGQFVEGTNDNDGTTGAYTSADAGGLSVGTDTTNRFSFEIPVSGSVAFGDLISALAIEPGMRISEFSNARFVSLPGEDGPGSSLPPVIPQPGTVSLVDGERLQQTITFEDIDSASWTVTIDYGDMTDETLELEDVLTIPLDHEYAGSGTYPVTVTVTDNTSQSASVTFDVIVSNLAPTVDFNLFTITSPVTEGTPITLTGKFNDTGALDNHRIRIEWGDNAIEEFDVSIGARDFTKTHVYQDDSNPSGSPTSVDVYQVKVSVIDQAGLADATPIGLLLAEVQNAAPSALNVNLVPEAIMEGNSVTLENFSFYDPGELDTHVVTVNWRDGSTPEVLELSASETGDLGGGVTFVRDRVTGVTTISGLTHTYLDDQAFGVDQYKIVVSVADDDEPQNAAEVEKTLAVANDIPTITSLDLGATATVDENGIATLTVDFTDSGINDRHTVEILWGDGSSPTRINLAAGVRSFSRMHQYLDDPSGTDVNETYPIRVRISDNDSAVDVYGEDTIDVIVNNVDPVISRQLVPVISDITFSKDGVIIPAGGTINEGDTITLTGSISDIGSRDRFTVLIDWNDQPIDPLDPTAHLTSARVDSFTRTFTATYTFGDDGEEEAGDPASFDVADIKVTVTDDDGGVAEVTTPLIVDNVAPQNVEIVPDATNANPATLVLNSRFTDPGARDTFTFAWSAWSGPTSGTEVQTGTEASFALDRSATLNDGDPDNDAYVVRLTVTDDNGESGVFETVVLAGSDASDTLVLSDNIFTTLNQTNLLVLGLGGEDIIDASAVTGGNNVTLDGGAGKDILFGAPVTIPITSAVVMTQRMWQVHVRMEPWFPYRSPLAARPLNWTAAMIATF